MNKTFRMTPDVIPYYGAVVCYGILIFALSVVFMAVHASYNGRVEADESGVSIAGAGFYNATLSYDDMEAFALIPMDRESAYYPVRRTNGTSAHDGVVGWAELSGGQTCRSLVSLSQTEGVYVEDAEGTCYLLAVQNTQGLMDVIERGTAGASIGEQQDFYRIPGSTLYYVFAFFIVVFLLVGTFVFWGMRRHYKPHVRATDDGIHIDHIRQWSVELPYAAIKHVNRVPVGPDTAYYPMPSAWSHNHKSKVGPFALPNGRTCTTLFSYAYDEGLYLETYDGACYLFTVEKADLLLDLIERQMARLSTA